MLHSHRGLKLLTVFASSLMVVGVVSLGVASGSPAVSASSHRAALVRAASRTLSTVWPQDITTMDPAFLSADEDNVLARNIYQPLLQEKFQVTKDGSLEFTAGQVTACLAESWTLGASSITFHLRPNVEFYGTTDYVNAQDVKFSLDRIFSSPGAGDLEGDGLLGPQDVHVVNDMTVKLDLFNPSGKPTPPTPVLMSIFADRFTSIVDYNEVKPHISASDPVGDKFLRSHAYGTGPYYIESRTPGVGMVLQAVPNSWAPLPYYTTINIRITSASTASLLQSHAVNIGEYGVTSMTVDQVNSLKQDGLAVYWQNTGYFDMFAITSDPASQVGALANLDVRKAIAYAIPYNTVVDDIYHGFGDRDYSIVSSTATEYTPAWSGYNTNLAKAKALMAAAGNPKITEPLNYLGNDVDQQDTALLIQANLRAIGITAVLTPQTQAGLFDVLDARSMPAKGAKIGPPGLELFNWSPWTVDPHIVIGYWATSGGINNYSLWHSPVVDAINNEYSLLPSSPARTAAYQKAQKIIAAAVPYIPVAELGTITVVSHGITGVSFTPGGSGRFWTLHPVGVTSPLDALFE